MPTARPDLAADLKALRQQLVAHPTDLGLALQLANGLIAAGRPAEAVQLLTTRTRDPACRERLREYLAGEREQSLLQRLLSHRLEQGVEAQVDAVLAAHLAGDFARAATLALATLRQFPQHAPAHNHLGRALFNSGDVNGARYAFEQALRWRPDYAEAHHNLAQVLRTSGQLDAAIKAFQAALQLAPAYRSALLHLGLSLLASERIGEAMACFEQLLQLNADHPQALLHAGSCSLLLGDHATARRHLQRAVQVDPRNPYALEQLAEVLLQQGEHEAALQALRKVLELAPQELGVWAHIAHIHQLAGRMDDAVNAVAHALTQAPGHVLLRITAARLARLRGNYSEALTRLREIEPEGLPPAERSALFFELGQCLDHEQQSAAAMTAFELAKAADSMGMLARMIDFEALDRRLDGLEQALSSAAPQAPVADADQGKDLAFVIGFPCSVEPGLVQLLHAQAGIRLVPESGALEQLLWRLQPALPATAEERDSLRARFREQIKAPRQANDNTLVLVTAALLPTDSISLHHLFPQARFVLALRHPLDVVLANFMHRHPPSEFSVHCYTLEETARLYVRVMRLWQRIRGAWPGLPVSVLRYETQVSDAAGALQPVCEFLGLPWTQALVTAASRMPGKRAAALWDRYREQLHSVLPQLKPVAERLGYPISGA